MKAIKSFSKIVIAFILALGLTTLTACDTLDGIFGGNKGDGKVYTVTLNANGGTFTTELTEYTSGTITNLPAEGTKEHYTFEGWFVNSECTGKAVAKISATATGNKEYWAKWKPDSYSVTFNIDNIKWDNAMTSYSYSTEATPLPIPTKSGSTFNGWYASSALTGDKISAIPAGDWGVKQYYGSWVAGETPDNPDSPDNPDKPDNPQPPASEVTVTAFGGYEEGAYIEFNTESGVSKYTVEYKAEGASKYTSVDSELIRISGNTVRADIVGISAGSYSIKVTAGTKTAEKDVKVSAYDRSGYAHFGATEGVGAYNDDGTPKKNAEIVYVTEETKNTVTAPWNSKIKGIVNILGDAKNADNPVIVRVIGRVAAATWDKGNWATLKAKYDAAEKNSSGKIINDASIVGINNTPLPTSSSSITQQKLIDGKYNKLQTDITELNGLVSKVTYSSGDTSGYDSYWNNCEISDASNVTVEGIGTDAMIFQWGLTWKKCSSIEVRNITFDDYTEDACSFEGSTDTTYTGMSVDKFNSNRLWVHNNVFNQGINYWDVCAEQDKREGDGATDFKRCAYITLAYNHYFNNHKTGLIGSDDNVFTANVTFHHNYYDQCNSRLPLARQANMHMYNNYYYMSSGTNMSIRSGAYAFIENCYFENAKNPIQTQLGTKSIKLNGKDVKLDGYVKVYNCTFIETQLDNKYKLDTSEYNITQVDDRAAKITNENIYNQNFDTSSTAFYYDSAANKSKVTRLDETANVPGVVKKLVGVHKN